MIIIKTPREIAIMKEAGRIAAVAQEEIKKAIKPGISTEKLDEIAYQVFRANDSISSFLGVDDYPKNICTSINQQVIHGIPSKRVILKEGDIISIDLGAYYKGYCSDCCQTHPVGKVSDEVLKLLQVTKNSLYEGIKQVKPGNRVYDISKAIEDYIKSQGDYGIVETYTGHGLGTTLHEDPVIPNYTEYKIDTILRPGMTIAIEPMVNLGSKHVRVLRDGWTVETIDKKYSAHFEHSVVITENGCEILTELSQGGFNGERQCN